MSSFDTIRLGAQPATQLASLTPYELRTLVLDYLCQQAYTKTARAFARDSTVRHLDADGDEIHTDADGATSDLPEKDMKQVELREQIRRYILSGQVEEATAMLNEHFPSVLSGPVPEKPHTSTDKSRITDAIPYIASTSVDPAHLTLNLRILAFIEACRTIPLPYRKPRGSTSMPSKESFPTTIPQNETPISSEQQLTLLAKAQKLLALASMLPNAADRELYTRELRNVGGLLAYKDPEHCSISKYLSWERREAVADQINSAILDRAGLPPVSSLELLTRYTMTTWSFANQIGVQARPGAVLPPTPSLTTSTSQKESEAVPPLDLECFLNVKA